MFLTAQEEIEIFQFKDKTVSREADKDIQCNGLIVLERFYEVISCRVPISPPSIAT